MFRLHADFTVNVPIRIQGVVVSGEMLESDQLWVLCSGTVLGGHAVIASTQDQARLLQMLDYVRDMI